MTRIILVSVFSFLTLCLSIIFILDFLNRKKLLKNGKATEAEIIQIEKYIDPSKDKITVKYRAEGFYYEGISYKPSHFLKPGDIIKIIYQVGNPKNYILEEELKKGRMIFDAIIAFIGLGIFLFMIIYAIIAPN